MHRDLPLRTVTDDILSPDLLMTPRGHFAHREHPEVCIRELRRVCKEQLA